MQTSIRDPISARDVLLHPPLLLIVLYTCKTSGTNLKSCGEKVSFILFYFHLFIFFNIRYEYVFFFLLIDFSKPIDEGDFCCYSDCGDTRNRKDRASI